MNKLPSVAAVICTRNRPDQIRAAIASLLVNDYPHLEVLIVDQSVDTSTARIVEEYLPDGRLRYLQTPSQGLSVARNIALRATTSEIVCFTDDDCVVASDWIATTVAAFLSRPIVHLVFGRVAPPAEHDTHGEFVPQYHPTERGPISYRRNSYLGVMGANMSLHRSVIDVIGYFDPMFGAGAPLWSAEDHDVVIRALAAGCTVISEPASVVVHRDGARRAQEAQTLWRRNGIAGGALLVKAARCGRWRVPLAVSLAVARRHVNVARALLARQQPTGLRRTWHTDLGLAQGFVRGMRLGVRHRKHQCLMQALGLR